MARGAKAKSAAWKLLHGNPGHRPLNTHEPAFQAGIPDKPAWFDTYESEEWDRLTSNLNGQRIFTKNDLGILVVICTAYAQFRECLAIIKKLGRTYVVEDMGGNKHYKTRPEAIRGETALKQYVSGLSEIGFTPSSRSKIKTLPEPPKPKGTAKFFTS